jgi:hypothetical protein
MFLQVRRDQFKEINTDCGPIQLTFLQVRSDWFKEGAVSVSYTVSR